MDPLLCCCFCPSLFSSDVEMSTTEFFKVFTFFATDAGPLLFFFFDRFLSGFFFFEASLFFLSVGL